VTGVAVTLIGVGIDMKVALSGPSIWSSTDPLVIEPAQTLN
jgi:hypothetical protein